MSGRQESSWDPAEVARTVAPYWHQHRLPVCCARCGRRITSIHRDCGHVLGEERHSAHPILDFPMSETAKARAPRWVLRYTPNDASQNAAHRWTIGTLDDRSGRRITFVCPNKRCGARITRRMDRLAAEFAAAMRAGRRKLVLGQGDHELG